MKRNRLKNIVQGLILSLIAYQPAWASASDAIQPEKVQDIALTTADKTSIWSSPWVPTGMSAVVPGAGQIYQSYQSDLFNLDRDWFLLVRGAVYLTVMGIGYWQLFDNMGKKEAGMVTLWSIVLVAANIASPADAFISGNLKQAHAEALAQK